MLAKQLREAVSFGQAQESRANALERHLKSSGALDLGGARWAGRFRAAAAWEWHAPRRELQLGAALPLGGAAAPPGGLAGAHGDRGVPAVRHAEQAGLQVLHQVWRHVAWLRRCLRLHS